MSFYWSERQLPNSRWARIWDERSGFKSWPGHCDVFLDKTLYSHSAPLQPGVQIGTSQFPGKPDELPGGNPDEQASHPRGSRKPVQAQVDGSHGSQEQTSPYYTLTSLWQQPLYHSFSPLLLRWHLFQVSAALCPIREQFIDFNWLTNLLKDAAILAELVLFPSMEESQLQFQIMKMYM